MYPYKDNWLTEETKIQQIEKHFEKILEILWLDLNDDSLKKTPYRIAKMYVKEIFKWLNPNNKPTISSFENKMWYNQMLIVKDIKVMSCCEHHFQSFLWYAYVWYIPNGRVIGLSKISRIVDFYSRKPQIQERLTEEIYNELKEVLDTENIMVVIKAKHHCMIIRWIEDINAQTITSKAGGSFKNDINSRQEFLNLIQINSI